MTSSTCFARRNRLRRRTRRGLKMTKADGDALLMAHRKQKSAPSTNSASRLRSSIPARARARVVHRHPSGAPERVEYFVGRSRVGGRLFDAEGELQLDYGIHHGKRHGRE